MDGPVDAADVAVSSDTNIATATAPQRRELDFDIMLPLRIEVYGDGDLGGEKLFVEVDAGAMSEEEDRELLLGGTEFGEEDGEGGSGAGIARPSAHLSICQMLLLNLGWAGLTAIALAWNIVTIPSQVRSTAGDEDAGRALSIMVSITAVIVVIITP